MTTTNLLENAELSSSHALLYHIKYLAKDWSFTNPYFQSLQALLFKYKKITLENLRTQQLFHFLAKILVDEINQDRSEVKNNALIINQLIDEFIINKRADDGEKALQSVYLINVLRLLDKKLHYKFVKKDSVKSLIKTFEPSTPKSNNIKIILCSLYLIEYHKDVTITDDYDLVVSLLFNKIQLARPDNRNENTLIEYYLIQKELEQKDYFTLVSESSKGKVLEIAVVLEAIVGKGLYLPDLEKEQYLSNYANNIIISKYNSIIDEMNQFKIYKIQIPTWSLFLIFYVIEIAIFSIPSVADTFTIPFLGIDVNLNYIRTLPTSNVIFLNAVIIIIILYYIVHRTKKQIRDAKW